MGVPKRWSGAGVAILGCAVFCLGIMVARRALDPLAGVKGWLANPFRFSTTVAPAAPVVLEQVQQLQRLETCRFTEQVIVRGDVDSRLPNWMAGDHILFVGSGEAVAGVDLSKVKADDIQVSGDKVTLTLPPSEILHTRLDNRQSSVYSRQTGVFNQPDKDLETKVRLEAEERIRKAALEGGILQTAEANAGATLQRTLKRLGFHDVVVKSGTTGKLLGPVAGVR